ncbi:uncharacterized protein EI90DRAFT_3032619 [Cantharellus anzutake]|uniref:uncharacterized protein n=1 Tax=Cantharellus anzutake TaxID=1750568 RepID=UPI001905B84B|nr:uncharacterized protein EI90DRAFT_3032619 [Cantharellus anzutake]KAF8342249.1 hypothetical protein EI90DRAFT_3032619 [Cantharellus anzutake]
MGQVIGCDLYFKCSIPLLGVLLCAQSAPCLDPRPCTIPSYKLGIQPNPITIHPLKTGINTLLSRPLFKRACALF